MPKVQSTEDRIRDNLISLEHPPASVVKILNGALNMLAQRGASRLSMSDICHVSGVSRGTLYRYFATKDDVLAAVSEYVSLTFETGIRDVAAGVADPITRLRAVLAYHNEFSGTQTPERLLAVEPAFLLDFFRTHFPRHRKAVLDALDPVFDHFEAQRGGAIDRYGVAEMLIRLQTSRLVLPVDGSWEGRWRALGMCLETSLGDPALSQNINEILGQG